MTQKLDGRLAAGVNGMALLHTSTVADLKDDRFSGLTAEELTHWAVEEFDDGLVMSTSFGIQASVTLHLATSIRPSIPVVWVDTGYLPKETYEYAETLTGLLDLNLYVVNASLSPAAMEVQYGRLWESDDVADLDLYDRIRKVEPMQKALRALNASSWISGLRASQTDFRKTLPRVKRKDGRYRVHPILNWTDRDVYYYMQQHGLPQHPLFEQGYTTVGDAHSSRPLMSGDEHDRETRFRGLKQECGIHLE